MSAPSHRAALAAAMATNVSRRTVLRRAVLLGAIVPGAAALLAACGGSASNTPAPAASTSAGASGGTSATTAATKTSGASTSASPIAPAKSSAAAAASSTAKAVVLAQGAPILYLDPDVEPTGVQENLHYLTHDQVLAFDPSYNVIPHLAEKWEIANPTSYTFTIRKGIKFQDGSDLTAEDIKFSLMRCVSDPNSQVKIEFCDAKSMFKEVTAPDPTTLQITLSSPYPPLLHLLTYDWFVVPEKLVQSQGAQAYNMHGIGSGPYKITEWVQNQHVSLDAFEDYFLGAPSIKKIMFRPIQEDATRVAALQRGEVDVIVNVPPDSIDLINKTKGIHVETTKVDRIIFLVMNSKMPPFDNVAVRQAVSYAIDWDTIIQTVMAGGAYRTEIPITPFDFPYDGLKDLTSLAYRYDPAKAKQLLAQAGHPNGFDLNLEGPNGRWTKDAETLQAVAGYLNAVGIRTQAQPEDWAYYYQQRFRTYKIAAGLFSMGNPIYDFDWIMEVYFDPDRSTQQFFIDPKLTDLAHKGIQTTDPKERTQIYHDAMTFIMQQAPFAWGFGLIDAFGVNDRVDWKPIQGDEIVRLQNAKLVG